MEQAAGAAAASAARGLSVIIVSCNGRHLLAEALPPTLAELAAAALPVEVIVVDNGSSDGTVAWLRAAHPGVTVLAAAGNAGFIGGNLLGARAARHPLLLLLNNDMALTPGAVAALLPHMADPSVFAVGSAIVDWDGLEVIETAKQVAFRDGWYALGRPVPDRAGPTLYATGGGVIIDREKFFALGGFDPLYRPMYMEDHDLSYRAWCAGWRVMHEPRAVTRHRLRASSNARFSESARRALVFRNALLWYWTCIRTPRLLVSHLLRLPWLVAGQACLDGPGALAAFVGALARLPRALASRRRVSRRVSDAAIAAALDGDA